MKVGRPHLSQDLERVRAMREHLGADFPLMVDANIRWSIDEAARGARGQAEFCVFWLEQSPRPRRGSPNCREFATPFSLVSKGDSLGAQPPGRGRIRRSRLSGQRMMASKWIPPMKMTCVPS